MRIQTGLSFVLGLLGLVTFSKGSQSICNRLYHGYDLIHHNLRCTYLGSEIDSNCRIGRRQPGERSQTYLGLVYHHKFSGNYEMCNPILRIFPGYAYDINAVAEDLASADLRNLTHYGYRLCFGCGSRDVSHCSRVAICTKESKCYRHPGQEAGMYNYGCCDSTCSDIQCFSTCEGNFCNGDQSEMNYISRLLSMGQTTTPVLGTGFSDWSSWSTCTAPCGMTGITIRTRVCLPGSACTGHTEENAPCTADLCTLTLVSTVRTTPKSTSVSCEDNEVGLQGTCEYWQNFDVCKPDSDAYMSIAKSHCRKTCGICS